MRVIERKMVRAVLAGKPMSDRNTTVSHMLIGDVRVTDVRLHGNKIATVTTGGADSLEITLAGWPTRTTRSRLNALLSEFAPGAHISQHNWEQWYSGPSQHGAGSMPMGSRETLTVPMSGSYNGDVRRIMARSRKVRDDSIAAHAAAIAAGRELREFGSSYGEI